MPSVLASAAGSDIEVTETLAVGLMLVAALVGIADQPDQAAVQDSTGGIGRRRKGSGPAHQSGPARHRPVLCRRGLSSGLLPEEKRHPLLPYLRKEIRLTGNACVIPGLIGNPFLWLCRERRSAFPTSKVQF